MREPDIKYLFEPRGVAIVGASHERGKIGYKLVENILKSGYRGGIYPVNRKGGSNLGLKYYRSLEEIDGPVDIALIAIPAKYVLESVRECGKAGVKFLVIITSGFAEVGEIEEEHRIVEEAHRYGMRVLGPNIFGLYSAKYDLNATFGPSYIKKGNIAIITQSGALGIAMIGKTAAENIGISTIVSVGNKSDIHEGDLLEYLIDDENTKVILMYIEGVKDGISLIEAIKKASVKKPVIVIKSGRSKRGALAAASHTGSLAGEDVVFDNIVRQCGALRATTIEEAFNWCRFLSDTVLPSGENTVIITNGGGIGVLATDACEVYGVNLYEDTRHLEELFNEVIPSFGSMKNPVDLTGQATDKDYTKALERALESDNIHSVIALYCETAMFDVEKTVSMIENAHTRYRGRKPIVFSAFGGEMIKETIARLSKKNIPVFEDVYEGVSSLGAMYRYFRHKNAAVESDKNETMLQDIDIDRIREVIDSVMRDGRRYLLSPEAQVVLDAMKIRRPRSMIAKNLKEAAEISNTIGYPVVMKVVSNDIVHKSDAGGVILNLQDEAEVIDAYQVIMRNCRKYKPDAKIDGVEISEMITEGTEVIVGGRKDRTFGPIVMFGLGGIYVEVMKDVTFRSYPLPHSEVMKMISEIRSYPVLLGVRGEPMKDIPAIADIIMKVGFLIKEIDEIRDIEINPLNVYEQSEGAVALDARILLSDEKRGEKK